jgi:outer membrane protein TolC
VADVMSAYGEVVIRTSLLDRARRLYDLVDMRYIVEQRRKDAGVISGVELSQAEVDRAMAMTALVRAETDRSIAITSLNVMIGRGTTDSTSADTTLRGITLPPLDTLRADLMARNPELLSAMREAESASHHVRMVDAALYPRIAAQAAYQYTNNQNDAGFILSNRTNGWNVGLTLQYNLFNGLADDVASQRARLDAERARLSADELRTQLDERLVTAWRRYDRALRTVDLERTSYAAAERNARVAIEQLRVGTITSVEARQAEQTLLDVSARALQVEFDAYLAAIECLRLAGRLVR